MKYRVVELNTMNAEKPELGSLSVLEGDKDIPFPIKRSYFVYGVSAGEERGFHAHKNLWQFLSCPYGSITIFLDDGDKTAEVILDHANKGLLLEPQMWHVMHWNIDNSVLCVTASDYYNENDYIRNYEQFKEYKRKIIEHES